MSIGLWAHLYSYFHTSGGAGSRDEQTGPREAIKGIYPAKRPGEETEREGNRNFESQIWERETAGFEGI